MGGIWKDIPVTYTIMWIGSLALAGIPFFSGFYSKDIIMEVDWVSSLPVGKVAFVCGMITVVLTAFYSWRLLLLTFHGKPRADEAVMGHIHESPVVMLLPLVVLAAGSLFSGSALYELFVGETTSFWGVAIFVLPEDNVIKAAHHVYDWVHWSPTFAAFLGIGLAYLFYAGTTNWPERLSSGFKGIYALLCHKWYFDELYDWLFVNPSLRLGKILWEEGDQEIIDGLGPNGLAAASIAGSTLLCRLQTGYVYHYALAMIIGVVLMIGFYLWV